MPNGYFQTPCRKRLNTRPQDLDGGDVQVVVNAVPGTAPGTFDITATLKPKPNFGDVSGFVTAGNASLYDALDTEIPAGTAPGPNTTGVPGALSIVFPGVAQSVSNVGNTWLLVIVGVEVTTKDGQTFTIPSLSKSFPSPL